MSICSKTMEEIVDTSEGPNRKQDKERVRAKPKKKKPKTDYKWMVLAFFLSFSISVILAFLSTMLDQLGLFFAFLILLVVMALGILFDFIGLAVTSSDIGSFHSMAARGNRVGQKGVWLIKNANKVSSFCSDVVGDISGVLSGAIGAAISIKLFAEDTPWGFWGDLLLTGAISAFIVGGKALFKGLALEYSQQVVSAVSKLLCLFTFSSASSAEKDKQEKE